MSEEAAAYLEQVRESDRTPEEAWADQQRLNEEIDLDPETVIDDGGVETE